MAIRWVISNYQPGAICRMRRLTRLIRPTDRGGRLDKAFTPHPAIQLPQCLHRTPLRPHFSGGLF
ncbi:hypothetical protein BTQ07_21650 [Escherichia coli]|nr:hypothetical protein BE933_10310 [Escherichia coli]KDV37558.1 hypothetical protein BU56_14825 [Escherichia coli O145:H25 str. 07-3858]AQV88432.1 hypothetical protein BE948_07015 [Escherichia coli]AUL65714.1 hypothetical protein BVL38_23975 [Escherichia coli]OKT33290.1 hypothetical protein ACN62_10775 [Escherichia coli]